MWQDSTEEREPMDVCVLEGSDAILKRVSLLEMLAERCGQPGAMHWLGYFLGGGGAKWKRPVLVLLVKPGVDGHGRVEADDLHAAVLFYELRVLGFGTGAYTTDDLEGIRTVVAPAGMRSYVTARAVRALLRQKAHVVLTSYACTKLDGKHPGPVLRASEVRWAERDRAVKKQLQLADTYDGTLAKFGKTTRTNMRFYRKRMLAKMDCKLVADVQTLLSEADISALNAASLNPVPDAECLRRFRASRDLPGGFLVGLRGAEGQWLSMAGGWRHGSTTVVHYQMNAAGYRKDSLGTVMRAFLLEHEVGLGTKTLVFYRGTPHPMSHAFDDEVVRDLLVCRTSWRAALLRRLAEIVDARNFWGSTAFLAAAMVSDEWNWTRGAAADAIAEGLPVAETLERFTANSNESLEYGLK